MFDRNVQEQIFSSITNQSEVAIRGELNKRARKLEEKYKSIRYSTTKFLITDARVNIDRNNVLSINLELNKEIEFIDIDKQNVPLVLERGGALRTKEKIVPVGGYYMRDILGVKL